MDLPKTAKRIEDSRDYIDIDGSVYGYELRKGHKRYGQLFKKSQNISCGYKYCSIYRLSLKKCVTMRVNRLVAKTFIENDCPEYKTVVAHRNNIKTDNRVENLYWATPRENTQQAVCDGLLVNDQGWDDSQSIHVIQYETSTNKKIKEYGSVSEASRETGISKSTILRQCRYNRPVRKPTYFRFVGDESTITNGLIYGYDMFTDELVGVYFNAVDAYNKTCVNMRTIYTDLKNNRKPKVIMKNRKVYFLHRKLSD